MHCVKNDCNNPRIPRGKYCQEHRTGKRCQEDGCKANAQGKTDFCIKHGGGKRCQEDGCKATAIGKTDFCIKHGGGKRCQEDGCKATAIGKTDFCVKHGGGKRCQEDGCKASAQGKTDFCVKHGGGKRCQEDGCKTGAEGKSDFCVKHGGGKRCQEDGCKASAQGKTDFCVKHGGGKRCKEDGCIAIARGKTDFCIKHGGGKRCPNCIDWPDSRSGSSKYDWYCATCFKRLFPGDPRSKIIYEHTKEIRVRNAINQNFEGFIHDRPIYIGDCDCTHRRRVDHRKLIGNTMLAIETDEFAHRGYEEKDEVDRYDDLYMIHSGKWIFIRFNPDDNREGMFKTDFEDKVNMLVQTIQNQVERIEEGTNDNLIEIIYLYY